MSGVDDAVAEVVAAERLLEQLLRDLVLLPRAEKVTVTPLIAEALTRVRAARGVLERVRTPDDSP